VKQEIKQLQKELPIDQYPARAASDLFKAFAWSLMLVVALGMAATEAANWRDNQRATLLALLAKLVLPLGVALFVYTRARFAWETPQRVAFVDVEDAAWARYWKSKEDAEGVDEGVDEGTDEGAAAPPRSSGG